MAVGLHGLKIAQVPKEGFLILFDSCEAEGNERGMWLKNCQ